MRPVLYALWYIIFCWTLVYVQRQQLETRKVSEMVKAVSYQYENSIHGSVAERRTIHDMYLPVHLHEWLTDVFTSVTFREQVNTTAAYGNWGEDVGWNESLSPATVGGFNRVALIRFSFKHWKMERKTGTFASVKPFVQAGKSPFLDPRSVSPEEETAPEGNKSWSRAGSYKEGGGYTYFFNPLDGKDSFLQGLEELKQQGFFNSDLATLVVDMLVINANIEIYLQIGWTFTFDFAGNCVVSRIASPVNYGLYNFSKPRALYLFWGQVFLCFMLAIFMAIELRQMWVMGLAHYFTNPGLVIDLISLVLLSFGIAFYWLLKINWVHIFTTFDMHNLMDTATQARFFTELEGVASGFQLLRSIIALDLLLVFCRAVFVLTSLSKHLGFVLSVVSAGLWNLIAFLSMFILMLCGFVFTAYFSFGESFEPVSSLPKSLFHCFAMIVGRGTNPNVADGPNAGSIYFLALLFVISYTIFFLVMVNVFLSILLSAYDLEEMRRKRHIHQPEGLWTRLKEEVLVDLNVLRRVMRFVSSYTDVFTRPLLRACRQWLRTYVPCLSRLEALRCCARRPGPTMPSTASASSAARFSDLEQQDQEKVVASTDASFKSGSSRRGPLQSKCGPSQVSRIFNCLSCLPMLLLMVFFLALVSLQIRAEVVFGIAQTTLHAQTDQASWQPGEDPLVIEDFSMISSFDGVYRWAEAVIPWQLYQNTVCAVFTGKTSEWQSLVDCDNANGTQRLVQQLNEWNIGFMNTTFVRLTIQPSCFVANPDPQWREVDPVLRQTPSEECAFADCSSILKEEQDCRTSDGFSLSEGLINEIGQVGPMSFNFSAPGELGAFMLRGGFAVSLGSTSDSAAEMLRTLRQDGWFSHKAASMVFDWITYNGNVDMFSMNTVAFSLLETGELVKSATSESVNLNIPNGGGWYQEGRIQILVYFSFCILLVAYFVIDLARTTRSRLVELMDEGKTFRDFLVDQVTDIHVLNDWFALVCSLVSIVLFLKWALIFFNNSDGGFRFSTGDIDKYLIPNSEVAKYNMVPSRSLERPREEDWYVYWQFERVRGWYLAFLSFAGANCFLISVKVVKHAGRLAPLRVFSNTFASGLARNLGIAITIAFGICGVSLFLEAQYGPQVRAVQDASSATLTLFYWMVGEFDINPFVQMDTYNGTIIFFIIFMIVFRFIAINVFLATMLNAYAKDQGEAEIHHVRRKVAREKAMHRATYPDAKRLQNDIELKYEGGDFVLERIVAEDGIAAHEGIPPGLIIEKINNNRWHFKRWKSVQELLDNVSIDPKTGGITLVFKKRPSGRRRLKALAGLQRRAPETAKVKTTVHSFWRGQGAIAFVELTARDEVMRLHGRQLEGDDANHAPEVSTTEMETKIRKEVQAKTKEKLDALLFDRYFRDRHLQLSSAAEEAEEEPRWEANSDTDPDELLGELEIEPTGQEVWLDCLVGAIEREMGPESVVTEVLRTPEMESTWLRGEATGQYVKRFRKNAFTVLKGLEHKSRKRHFQYLERESQERQRSIREQNEVLHDYVCELEEMFGEVNLAKTKLEHTKTDMLKKMAGLLPVSCGVQEEDQEDDYMMHTQTAWR